MMYLDSKAMHSIFITECHRTIDNQGDLVINYCVIFLLPWKMCFMHFCNKPYNNGRRITLSSNWKSITIDITDESSNQLLFSETINTFKILSTIIVGLFLFTIANLAKLQKKRISSHFLQELLLPSCIILVY